MARIGLVVICCFMLTGCAVPLGVAAASFAGGAATEAGSKLGRDAVMTMALWLRGDDPQVDVCKRNPAADGCDPEELLAEYLKKAPPEQRERILAALTPELREEMEAALGERWPEPAYGVSQDALEEPPSPPAPPPPVRLAPPPRPIGPLTPADAYGL